MPRDARSLVFIQAIAAAVAICAFGTCQPVAGQGYFQKDCKVGPEYCRPVAPVAPGWIDEGNPRVQIHSTWRCREQYWWTSFNDPVLSSLIENAYGQNLTLRAAGMRILTAQAQRDIVTGELFPQVQELFGGTSRIAESLETANANGIGGNRFFGDWVVGGQLAWELDFWGKFRRSVTAANARLDAKIEDYDDVLVVLVADVASTYVEIRTLNQRLAYARQNLDIQNESVRLAQMKFDAGARESQLDLPQAQSNQAEIASLIPDLELARRRAMNRLCVLLGMPPANIEALLGQGRIPAPPSDIAIGIPADLLRQRPDVRSSERRLAAQCEEIGIAVANMYPHVSIHGTLFVNAEHSTDLFRNSAFAGAVGPTFRWDVLNYGRLRGRVREQEAIFNELLYDYQQTVLRANQEAENAIALFLFSHQKVVALQGGTTASSKAVNLGLQRYEDGLADFNRLSNVQLDLARQQDDMAFAQGQIAQGWIEVYRSLGGGWQIRLANATPYMPGIEQPAIDTLDELPAAAPSEEPPQTAPGKPDDANVQENVNQSAAQNRDQVQAHAGVNAKPVVRGEQTSTSMRAVISKSFGAFRRRWISNDSTSVAASGSRGSELSAENQIGATLTPTTRLTENRQSRTRPSIQGSDRSLRIPDMLASSSIAPYPAPSVSSNAVVNAPERQTSAPRKTAAGSSCVTAL